MKQQLKCFIAEDLRATVLGRLRQTGLQDW